MYNAKHPFTLPQDFTLTVAPVSRSWSEGTGLDMDEYKDIGVSNWLKSDTTTFWTKVGGDYLTDVESEVTFPQGFEDLELDITDVVERWITGSAGGQFENYGFGISLTSSQEAYFSSSTGADVGSTIDNPTGATQSYYTKKFFARSSEFFFKRPVIEARFDDRTSDDRENFFYSSSLAPAAENLNNLVLYNYVRGRLYNAPTVGTDDILVSFYSSVNGSPTGSKILLPAGGGVAAALDVNATGTFVSTGIYECSIALTAAASPLQEVHDVWHKAGTEFFTGSFYPEKMPTYDSAPTFDRNTACKNLKKVYSQQDKSRFRFFVRSKDWSPTIYTVATANNPTEIIESASFSVTRVIDDLVAIPYGTGSNYSTYLSYDKEGNYFDLDMSLLETGYMYEIKLSYYNDSIGDWQEQTQTFKFRVEE